MEILHDLTVNRARGDFFFYQPWARGEISGAPWDDLLVMATYGHMARSEPEEVRPERPQFPSQEFRTGFSESQLLELRFGIEKERSGI